MSELSLWSRNWIRVHTRSVLAVFVPLLVQWPVCSQAPAWHAGVAKVTVRADLSLEPGTAFVVAVEDGKAFLVTSAHVVEGDPNPQIEFVADRRKQQYSCTVQNSQPRETHGLHGLAILVVNNPPAGISVLPPSISPRPIQGENVIVAGYPAPIREFMVTDTTVGAFKGGDLVLNRDTGKGYSGGPVLRNGSVVGLVFGREAGFGLAVPSSLVQNYLQEYALSWGSKSDPPAAESVKAVPPSERKAGEVRRNPDDGQNYVWIPPGEFQMGCSPGDNECYDDEKPAHKVTIARGFWLGQTEVTVAAYRRAPGVTMPGEPILGERKLNPQWSDQEQPMVAVTWAEAKSYCETRAKGRLPTEAEWEYAARAGSRAARYGELDRIAWYAGNSGTKSLNAQRAWEQDAGKDWSKYLGILEKNGNQIHKVGQRLPNSWALYDMLGNVLEWVTDWYDKDYYQTLASGVVDPKGPAAKTERVLRGGSWGYSPWYVRASLRVTNGPEVRFNLIGFRCAREVIP